MGVSDILTAAHMEFRSGLSDPKRPKRHQLGVYGSEPARIREGPSTTRALHKRLGSDCQVASVATLQLWRATGSSPMAALAPFSGSFSAGPPSLSPISSDFLQKKRQ